MLDDEHVPLQSVMDKLPEVDEEADKFIKLVCGKAEPKGEDTTVE